MSLPGCARQGATGTTGKATLGCVWQPDGKQAPCCLGCAAAGAPGKVWGRTVVPPVSTRRTVTPRGVGPCHCSAPGSSLHRLRAVVQLKGRLSCRLDLLPSAVASKHVKSECPAHVRPLASLRGVPAALAQPPTGHTAHLLLHGAPGVGRSLWGTLCTTQGHTCGPEPSLCWGGPA